MNKFINRFILMIQFFTRIPINKNVPVEKDDFRGGSVFLPIIGLIIGGVSAVFYWGSSSLWGSMFSAAAAVGIWAAVTGGLHLDGLSDTFDGLFSSRSRERMLEIMKDSRIGAMGALALLFDVIFKISLVSDMSFKAACFSLLIAPAAGRMSMLFVVSIAKSARPGGLGTTFIGNIRFKEVIIGLAITIAIIAPVMKLYTALLILLIFTGSYIINSYIGKRLGGMTGDTLGALCEIQEILCLAMLSALSSFIWN